MVKIKFSPLTLGLLSSTLIVFIYVSEYISEVFYKPKVLILMFSITMIVAVLGIVTGVKWLDKEVGNKISNILGSIISSIAVLIALFLFIALTL